MYSLKAQVMNKTCPHCGMVFEREPGYFYVAMLVSYAMFVAEMVTLAVAIHVLTGSSNPWLYVLIIISVGVLLSPFNFRYSRVMLLHWLTPGLHYQPETSGDKQI
jgi:predicted benzoate:H+ symporter BenE